MGALKPVPVKRKPVFWTVSGKNDNIFTRPVSGPPWPDTDSNPVRVATLCLVPREIPSRENDLKPTIRNACYGITIGKRSRKRMPSVIG